MTSTASHGEVLVDGDLLGVSWDICPKASPSNCDGATWTCAIPIAGASLHYPSKADQIRSEGWDSACNAAMDPTPYQA